MTKNTEITREDRLAKLREDFPKNAYGKLPKPYKKDSPKGQCNECGGYHGLPAIHLDYIGHATVTDRLLTVDPEWNWEPCAMGDDGLPKFVRTQHGQAIGLWIRLTVLGITRMGYGSVEPGAFEAEKQLIGDALRNAAMRFGVALDLWSKAELESAALSQGHGHDEKTGEVTRHELPKPPAQPKAPAPAPAARAPAPTPKETAKLASRPAPPQEPRSEGFPGEELDRNARLELDEHGNLTFLGIPIPAKMADTFDNWGKYKASEKAKGLVGYTWHELLDGSRGGNRERGLRYTVARSIDDITHGKEPIDWSRKAAYTLYRLWQAQDARDPVDPIFGGRDSDPPLDSATLFNGKDDDTPF